MRRFVLVGNYGVGNLGDEALKQYFLQEFKDIDWKVLSACPSAEESPRLPCGIRSIFTPWWKTLGAIIRSDGVVFGGGSLFTDIESVYACVLWWWHAFVIRLLRKPVHLAFHGVGPFKTKLGEKCARWVIKRSSSISVRDEESFDRIKSWKKKSEVIQSFDPVIAMINQSVKGGSGIVIIPRANSGDDFINRALDLGSDSDEVKILSLQPESSSEKKVCDQLNRELDAEVIPIRTLDELAEEIAKGSKILSHRYHGALVALALGKDLEVVTQGKGDKLHSIQEIVTSGKPVDALKELVERGKKELQKSL